MSRVHCLNHASHLCTHLQGRLKPTEPTGKTREAAAKANSCCDTHCLLLRSPLGHRSSPLARQAFQSPRQHTLSAAMLRAAASTLLRQLPRFLSSPAAVAAPRSRPLVAAPVCCAPPPAVAATKPPAIPPVKRISRGGFFELLCQGGGVSCVAVACSGPCPQAHILGSPRAAPATSHCWLPPRR